MFRTKLQPHQKSLILWAFVLAFAELLHGVALYQLEIVYIAITEGWGKFDMPFYIWSTTNFPLARDIWYAVDFISRVIGYYGLYNLIATILSHNYGIKINLLTNIRRIITDRNGKKD